MVTALQIKLAFEGDLTGYADRTSAAFRRGAMCGAVRFEALAKLRYRQDVVNAGLGQRLANTWRTKVYPEGKAQSWHPAVAVHSNAPEIIAAHADGATIRSKSGVYLAIPTENVPRRSGHRMTPVEVEAQFNQDLIVKKSKAPGVFLAFVDVLTSRSGKGFRPATKRRLAQGRKPELVLMFILVRQVTLRPVLNWRSLETQLAPNFRDYLAQEIATEMASA